MTVVQPIRPDEGPSLLRFSVAQFQAMAEAGVFAGGSRVELRGGAAVRDDAAVPASPDRQRRDARSAFRGVAGGSSLLVSSEGSVRLGDHDAPMPDIIVWEMLRGPGAVPGERVRLAVEVSDTTAKDDLGPKRALYAAAPIPEYWVVDLPARAVRQFRAPVDGAHGQSAAVPFGETLRSATLPEIAVPTGALDGGDAPT